MNKEATCLPELRVIIAGSRDFCDYVFLSDTCNCLLSRKVQTNTIVIISGGARGADRMGEQYAEEKGYEIRRFIPDWEKEGKKAGYLRNTQMAENADALIAFWDEKSRGTKNMIDTARKKGLLVRVVKVGNRI